MLKNRIILVVFLSVLILSAVFLTNYIQAQINIWKDFNMAGSGSQKVIYGVAAPAGNNYVATKGYVDPYFYWFKSGGNLLPAIWSGGTLIADTATNLVLGDNPTNDAVKKLEVRGGAIKATGGLIIEARTTNPGTADVGRMWICSDTNVGGDGIAGNCQ